MKVMTSSNLAAAVLLLCCAFSSCVAASSAVADAEQHHPNYLRGIIITTTQDSNNNNYNDASSYIQLPCSQLTNPVDYEECQTRNVQGCTDDSGRALKQCYRVVSASVTPLYVCSPANQCDTSTTTTTAATTAPSPNDDTPMNHNERRQVDNELCNGPCNGDDVCWDHFFNNKHIYYCDRIPETKTFPTTAPSKCTQSNQECDPDSSDEEKKCCGTLKCLSVEENVPERSRQQYGAIKYACLGLRGSIEGGVEGDFVVDE